MTPYMTGADVANVCATAGRIAARRGSDAVELEHFSAAVDRVQHGLEKPDRVRMMGRIARRVLAWFGLDGDDSHPSVSFVWTGWRR